MISIDTKDLDMAKILLDGVKNGMGKAVSRAINRASTTAKTAISVETRKEYAVTAGAIKQTIAAQKASSSRLKASITTKGSPILLGEFKVNQGKNGVTAKVKKGNSPKVINRGFIAHSTKSGFVGTVIRTSSKGYPIKVAYGPSVPQMVGNEKVSKIVEDKAQETLNKRFAHEVEAVLKGYGSK